jgi:outer membrane biosynthesis protein TonB
VAFGDFNALNTRESVYYSFYSRIYRQIAPLWNRHVREAAERVALAPAEYTTIVEAVLDRRGDLLRLDFVAPSGVAALDRAVEDSWKKAERFPNPPAGLLEASGEVRLKWKYTVDASGSSGLFFPSPRRPAPTP